MLLPSSLARTGTSQNKKLNQYMIYFHSKSLVKCKVLGGDGVTTTALGLDGCVPGECAGGGGGGGKTRPLGVVRLFVLVVDTAGITCCATL